MAENRRLVRSTRDRVLGGVSAGLARYLGVDPVLIRLGFVILMLINGLGLLIYTVMWLIIPPEDQPDLPGEEAIRVNFEDMRQSAGRLIEQVPALPVLGVVLISIGALFLLAEFVPTINIRMVWPAVLILIGALLLFRRR
ncbi:MAG: PspC domain-containing protein [Chloroflexi bacterium]|nr:PspC domain-containing protein [Chloroflexota bacterium]